MFKLDVIAKRLSEMFPDDPSAPSVLCSWIADKEHYYVSVSRYSEAFGRGRTVLLKATGATSEEALDRMCEALGISFAAPLEPDTTVQVGA